KEQIDAKPGAVCPSIVRKLSGAGAGECWESAKNCSAVRLFCVAQIDASREESPCTAVPKSPMAAGLARQMMPAVFSNSAGQAALSNSKTTTDFIDRLLQLPALRLRILFSIRILR